MSWLNGWTYRKNVTLSRASGAVTDYQMKLLVGESSGAVGEDVDCGGFCADDFDDIRFTKADGITFIDYWIESISGETPNQVAVIWIEFDSIGTGATSFYIYYGNPEASAASSGANTFPFFDDFPGDSLDGEKWGTSGSPTVSVSGSILTVSSPSSADRAVFGKTDFGTGYAFRSRMKSLHNNSSYDESYGMRRDSPSLAWSWAQLSHTTDLEKYRNRDTSGSSSYGSMGSWAADTFAILEVFRWTSSAIWNVNGAEVVEVSGNYDTGAMHPYIYIYTTNASVSVEWCLIRKRLATEPAWGAWGQEEIDQILDAAGINDVVDAYDFKGDLSDPSGAGDAVVAIVEINAAMSDAAGAGDAVIGSEENYGDQADGAGAADDTDAFNWTKWLRDNRNLSIARFYCTLTGAADGVADIEVPISSFQARKRAGYSTYLSVVVPGIAQADAIEARANGDIVIEMAYLIGGAESIREEIVRADIEQINLNEGPSSRSITLIGHSDQEFVGKESRLYDPIYRYRSDGRLGYRFAVPDLYLNPGDTAQIDDDEFTVDQVVYMVSAEGQTVMEVQE